ncbi:TPR-like protein [Dissoconium aciculare CBS 342.82]|uniref:TPR-like protein n=1 Tax=Dissoconium aciculare CBS 342.82 TaxID=1314786 RepID=A0A6J3LRP2_9PEZI|nr:TPR-like protein [Dissoconium aciculare CBS 342.82]KAF1818501.1 TPR-like protein [Dissoconium aciculare CBS 342.82]
MYGSDKASHNVPFPRDRDFIQRPDLTDQITAALAIPQARLALVGVGGVGKSQIAINYCYHVRDESPRTWVFWIHASNAARYSQGVRDCLDLADVDKRFDPQVNIHELFRNWLRSRDSGRWLIVIDNADEIDFLVERSNGQTPLFKHLPPCNHGTILITSRSKISALKLVEPKEIVEIPPMGEQQAIALIEKQLGPNSGIQRLARALDYMPLAMSQAAAYIKNRGKRFSIERYIEKLQKGDQSKRSILDEEVGDLRRDDEARNAIALTWQISFEHIRRLRRSAADLLSLMSFCDRQAIPENLLKVKRESRQDEKIPDGNHSDDNIDDMSSDASSDDGSDTSQDDGFEKDVIMLEGFAFISITTAEESTYEMHRLVQRATQRWLQSQKQFEHWRAAFLYNLADIHPSGEYENWKECQTLRPHVRAALDLNVMHRDELLDLASTCFKAGWYAYQMHLDSEAAEMYTRAYAISCQERGEDHDGSLGIVNDLALVRLRQGRLAEAEKLQKKVLKTRALSLEAEHPRMLMSMHNLALTYSYQERWGEAEELLAKVLETKYVVFGKQHRDTLLSMYDLAYLFQRQKRWTEAEELTVEVLEIRRRMLGADHPDTLDSMADLAAMYRGREQWEKAEELYMKTVEARQRVLGLAHNSTSASMAALSRIYYKQNRWAEAEQMLSKVVETRTKFEGAEHIDTLFDMHELACIYMVLERWEEAASFLEKVVEARQRVLGPQHKNTLISMSKLSDVYYEQNRWAEAALLRAKEVETRAKSQGEEDEETLFAMHELAVIYVAQERWKEAESLLEKVVETRQRVLGPEHKNTLISMSKLADIYCKQCRWAEAASLRAKEVEIRVRVQGAENEDTLFAMHELAVVYRAQSRQPEARELLVKVVDARSRVLGSEHPDTLESRIRLSDVSSESSQ